MRPCAFGAALALCACGASSSEQPPATPQPWFEEVAESAGLVFTYRSGHEQEYLMPEIMGGGAGLLDLEGDGDLDVYLVQGGSLGAPSDARNQLFRNAGALRFEDVSAGSGADHPGYGMGVACGDADDDGDTDLYVTNYGPNALLLNDGTGRFEDATEAAGAGHAGWGTSAAFFDHDRDGSLDLYVCNYLDWRPGVELSCYNALAQPDYCSPKTYATPARHVLYRNGPGTRFEDVSEASGIGKQRGNGLGVATGDFDDDGWPDVYVANDGSPNFLWRNQRDGTFSDVARLAGCAVDEDGVLKAGMGVAVVDLDGDQDLDVLVGNLRGESDSVYENSGAVFLDRGARFGLGPVNRSYTRFGLGVLDFDNDGRLDLFQANGRVNRSGQQFSADPYAEPVLVFRGAAGRFHLLAAQASGLDGRAATSRAAAFGDLDDDGGVDAVVVNRDGPAYLLRNRAGRAGNWVVLRLLESSGRDAIGAIAFIQIGGTTLRREVSPAYSYLAGNDPRIHLGLGSATQVDAVEVRWVAGEREIFGPHPAGQVHALRRGAGLPGGR
jgi:hypothetical protein